MAAAGPLTLVAAENIYGGVAREIAGGTVEVVSILNNPDQDPHLFESSPAAARQVADARIVILNGAGYDPWMAKLLAAAPRPGRTVIDVADLMARRPATIRTCGTTRRPCPRWRPPSPLRSPRPIPTTRPIMRRGSKTSLAALAPVQERAADLRAKWAGTAVTATEPVFGPWPTRLG